MVNIQKWIKILFTGLEKNSKIKSIKDRDKFDYMTIYFVGNNFNLTKSYYLNKKKRL